MVWHQAIAEQTHWNPISSLLDQFEKCGIVTILVEDRIVEPQTIDRRYAALGTFAGFLSAGCCLTAVAFAPYSI